MLTLIKLFIGVVHPMGGTEAYLVAKIYPTIKNEWKLGEENEKNKELYKGKWFYEEKYTIISIGENGVVGQKALTVLVILWWVMTFSLAFTAIRRISTKGYEFNLEGNHENQSKR